MDYTILLRSHLDERGRLVRYPTKFKQRLLVQLYLAQKFESGRIYTESEVNDLLDEWHIFHDPAMLRRDLFTSRLIDRKRDGSAYWLNPERPTHDELMAKVS